MSFSAGLLARESRGIRIVGNTFYIPLITNMNIGGDADFAMQRNLFFSQHAQKYRVHMMECPRTRDVDYNAYCFHPDDEYRYIGGHGLIAPKDGSGKGLEGWRKGGRNDAQSIVLTPEQVKFVHVPAVSSRDRAYAGFWRPYRNGEKIPTLSLFEVAPDSALNGAGPEGTDIGAR
jgi:hypothetical protein